MTTKQVREPKEYTGTKSEYRKWNEMLHAYLNAHDTLLTKVLCFIDDFGRRSFQPEDLLDYPWLEELGTHESSAWLTFLGMDRKRVSARTQVPGHLMIDGARNGQGIAVTTRIAVSEDLAAGRLIAVFEDRRDAGYHIVTRKGAHRPPLKAFLLWLRREAAKT